MDISLARPYDEEFRATAFKQVHQPHLPTSSQHLDVGLGFTKLGPDQSTAIDNTILFLALFYEIVQLGEGRYLSVEELVNVLNYEWTYDLDWLAAFLDLHNPAEV
ncbi:hypothetical protein FALBO_4032 [Fusarium albosuccineum]|uniref:Uncharacterized protein n=2 Tax=Fusarium decemcellulare species complex TaxID=1329916 RepID=A0A8H4LJL3_9HYPO|nr:hypothetical protein FALBO_4032 [Fusarium albosuccineum]KAJ3537069.1 hypothetical protein NM208_g6465 [Fusarium decemcellulare]